jgi:hypothetical protein
MAGVPRSSHQLRRSFRIHLTPYPAVGSKVSSLSPAVTRRARSGYQWSRALGVIRRQFAAVSCAANWHQGCKGTWMKHRLTLLLVLISCSSVVDVQSSRGVLEAGVDAGSEPDAGRMDARADSSPPRFDSPSEVCQSPESSNELLDVPIAASFEGKPLALTAAFARRSIFQGSGAVPIYEVQILSGSDRSCDSRPSSSGPERLASISVPVREGTACAPRGLNFSFVEIDGGSSTGSLGIETGRVEIHNVRPKAFTLRVDIQSAPAYGPGGGGRPIPNSSLVGTVDVTLCP